MSKASQAEGLSDAAALEGVKNVNRPFFCVQAESLAPFLLTRWTPTVDRGRGEAIKRPFAMLPSGSDTFLFQNQSGFGIPAMRDDMTHAAAIKSNRVKLAGWTLLPSPGLHAAYFSVPFTFPFLFHFV